MLWKKATTVVIITAAVILAGGATTIAVKAAAAANSKDETSLQGTWYGEEVNARPGECRLTGNGHLPELPGRAPRRVV